MLNTFLNFSKITIFLKDDKMADVNSALHFILAMERLL